MYFDELKDFCNLCSDVVDSETYCENEGYCDICFEYTEECEYCGDRFYIQDMINGKCENCYDTYRDEMHDC